jgi:hypothetical protein
MKLVVRAGNERQLTSAVKIQALSAPTACVRFSMNGEQQAQRDLAVPSLSYAVVDA